MTLTLYTIAAATAYLTAGHLVGRYQISRLKPAPDDEGDQ